MHEMEKKMKRKEDDERALCYDFGNYDHGCDTRFHVHI
jgi:hypothetical protein